MCATCGCGDDSGTRVTLLPASTQAHSHPHPDHHHDHDHEPHPQETTNSDRTIVLEQQILAKNVALADHNRRWLAERGILAINLMSSPGAGKTTLLERTIRELGAEMRVSVVEGDQET